MSETFADHGAGAMGSKRKPVRLVLEELEGRCLLSNGGITVGPDGNLWFPEGNRIGQLNPISGVIQQFNLPAGSDMEGEIIAGADGNLWFSRGHYVDKLNPSSGAVQQFPLPLGDDTEMGVNITVAADGSLWFPFYSGQGWWVGRLDPTTGQTKAFSPLDRVGDLAAGSDGSIWFTDTSRFGRINPQTGSIQEFSTSGGTPVGLSVARDGTVWVEVSNYDPIIGLGGYLESVDPTTAQIKQFTLPASVSPIGCITASPDGTLWYIATDMQVLTMGKFDPSTGVFQMPDLSGVHHEAGGGITAQPDGSIWFLEGPWIAEYFPASGTFQEFSLAPTSSSQEPKTSPAVSSNTVAANGATISADVGINFMDVVATLTPQTPIASPGAAYQAKIDWGNGTTSSFVLTVTDNATYDVTAGHTYQTAGTYSIKVTIGNYNPANPLGDNPVTVFSTANVNDPFNINM